MNGAKSIAVGAPCAGISEVGTFSLFSARRKDLLEFARALGIRTKPVRNFFNFHKIKFLARARKRKVVHTIFLYMFFSRLPS